MLLGKGLLLSFFSLINFVMISGLNASCFGGHITEGYGMTETSCAISAMDEDDNLTGHVGSPNPACGRLLT